MDYIIKEKKDGTTVTVRMLQLKLLTMMKEIDRVCKKNDIKYFLAGGSCLGAVRHKGFIPWDDDMDIAMSRSEYKKFINALEKDLGDDYVFHCYEKNKRFPVTWPAMKIRMKNTYIKEINILLPNTCKDCDGIFIDVFIYDYMSNNKILDFPLRFANTILMPIIVFFENMGINFIPLKEIYRFNARIYGKLCRKSDYFGDELTWTFRLKNPFKYKYSDIYPIKYIEFEDTKFPVPGNYHEYLRKNYGETYMTPPKEGKRFAKHTLDINLESSEAEIIVKDDKKILRIAVLGLLLNIIAIFLRNIVSLFICPIGIALLLIGIVLYKKNKY
ncbi:MAG: LicD family protein [Lactobacillales bacterium]|nr:LicD family protein [Lactobacillales bacterium]